MELHSNAITAFGVSCNSWHVVTILFLAVNSYDPIKTCTSCHWEDKTQVRMSWNGWNSTIKRIFFVNFVFTLSIISLTFLKMVTCIMVTCIEEIASLSLYFWFYPSSYHQVYDAIKHIIHYWIVNFYNTMHFMNKGNQWKPSDHHIFLY